MINIFFHALLRMSLQGIVIIAIILLVRFYLKKLDINHKYLVGLWLIVFFYLVFPWRISVSFGFWTPSENVIVESEGNYQENGIVQDQDGNMQEEVPINSENILDKEKQNASTSKYLDLKDVYALFRNVIAPYVWLLLLLCFSIHIFFSYFNTKKKLAFSIPYMDNIWWTEAINAPMVFGLVKPQIYLPISMKDDNLDYVILHEKMHIRRKDYLIKLMAYMVCMFHWFNPFVWLAYVCLENDIEKACDEAVIQKTKQQEKKEYAYSIVQFCAKDNIKKKKIFVAPVGFNEGRIMDRIKNILKYKYTLPEIGAFVIILGVAVAALFMTEQMPKVTENMQNGLDDSEIKENVGNDTDVENSDSEIGEKIPTFLVESIDTLQVRDSATVEDYYITSRYTGSYHLYIDENGVLWKKERAYDNAPVKIAEHVVSVDASWNDYFYIYLTGKGELYGIDLENYSTQLFCDGMLMMDVAYARAGMESIVVLKKEGSVYCWGNYDRKSERMLISEPTKIMENCRYVTSGDYTVAAITEKDEVYTWGYNAVGECGTEVSEEVFVRTPTKVCENAKMVWIGKICFNELANQDLGRHLYYSRNTFILTKDDALFATGYGLGKKEQITDNFESGITETILYSDCFVPVQVMKYKEGVE